MSSFIGGEAAQRWGPVLISAALFYSFVALAATVAVEAGGGSMSVQLVPPVIASLYAETYKAWTGLSSVLGKAYGWSDLFFAAWDLAKALAVSSFAILGIMATTVFAYILLAVVVTELIPYPFTIVSVVVWIAGSIAQIILIEYVIEKITPIVENLINTALGIFSSRV